MKRILSLLLGFALMSMCMITASAEDYSFLDDMTLEELEDLQEEIEIRIIAAKIDAEAQNPSDTGNWDIRYYVDEFNNPTSEVYITNRLYIIGTFSNSATTNSELKVVWLVDENDVAIKLLEYGNNVVKNSYEPTYYSILMLDPDGNKIKMSGTMYKGSDRIYIDEEYEDTVLEALGQNKSVSFKITETGKYASSSYLFTMEDTSYFNNAYKLLNS